MKEIEDCRWANIIVIIVGENHQWILKCTRRKLDEKQDVRIISEYLLTIRLVNYKEKIVLYSVRTQQTPLLPRDQG